MNNEYNSNTTDFQQIFINVYSQILSPGSTAVRNNNHRQKALPTWHSHTSGFGEQKINKISKMYSVEDAKC